MSMDRESVFWKDEFPAGNAGESSGITHARYAWMMISLPKTFVAGDITFEIWNELTEEWTAAVDETGSPVPAVAATPGMCFPLPSFVSYCKIFRMKAAGAQPDNLEFGVTGKT